METVRQVEFLLAEVRREAQRIHERRSQEYLERLEAFVNDLLRRPLRWYWRQDLAEYLIMAELDGYRLRPESVRVLENWIEEWAAHLGHLPADPTQPATIDEAISDGGSMRGFPPARSSPEGVGPSSPLTVPPAASPTAPAKQAPPSQALPKNWPKLTPEEIDRIEINAGRRWWYPLVPVGETDWIWLSKLEVSAQKARESLTALYQDLAALGRMAKEFGDSQSENIEPLLAKQADIQRHYDRYLECLIAIEITWRDYLRRVIVVIGVHVIALKEKIDRSLPLRVEGFHSSFDGQFKTALSESREALQVARGRVERGYTILIWTDRAVMAAQFVLPLAAAGKVAFAAAVKQGFSEFAAFRIAVKTVLVGVVKAVVVGAAMSEVIPYVLAGLGIDEAEVRAGMTILLSLVSLGSALKGTGRRPPSSVKPWKPLPPVPMPPPAWFRKYWVKWVEFDGVKVYQRNDLIDPRRLDVRGRSSLSRMNRGYPPIGPDDSPMNLHHVLQTQDGPLAEMTETFHIDNRKTIHINPQTTPLEIDRPISRAFNRAYWMRRAYDFEGQ